MLTDIQIINLGLSKGSSSRIRQIAPPLTQLEQFMAGNYAQWKREELAKRRWVFAMVDNYAPVLSATIPNVDKPFKYNLPNDCLRPLRGKRTEWKQRGRALYSNYSSGLLFDYISNIAESEFDPLFNEVLACKIWWESCEYVTQSNTKKQDAEAKYDRAVRTAAQANAFVIGPEDIEDVDEDFDFVNARYTGMPG